MSSSKSGTLMTCTKLCMFSLYLVPPVNSKQDRKLFCFWYSIWHCTWKSTLCLFYFSFFNFILLFFFISMWTECFNKNVKEKGLWNKSWKREIRGKCHHRHNKVLDQQVQHFLSTLFNFINVSTFNALGYPDEWCWLTFSLLVQREQCWILLTTSLNIFQQLYSTLLNGIKPL